MNLYGIWHGHHQTVERPEISWLALQIATKYKKPMLKSPSLSKTHQSYLYVEELIVRANDKAGPDYGR